MTDVWKVNKHFIHPYRSEQPDVPALNDLFSHELRSELVSEQTNERIASVPTSEASSAERANEWPVQADKWTSADDDFWLF